MPDIQDLEALTAIVSALKNMDEASQKRIIKAAITFLDIAPLNQENTQQKTYLQPIPIENNQDTYSNNFSERRNISVKDFIRDKMPKSDVERIACLGYYLTHYRETPHFKTLDLSTLNTEAAQPKLSNAAYAVDNATKAGLLAPAVKGSKQISSVGEMFVQALPDREEAKNVLSTMRVKRKAKRPSKKGPNNSAENSSALDNIQDQQTTINES